MFFLANVIFLIFIFTSFYIVQEPLPSPSTSTQAPLCLDIADVMPDSISGFGLFLGGVFNIKKCASIVFNY